MNAPVRFLLLALAGWAAFRAASYALGPSIPEKVPLAPPPMSPLGELAPTPGSASTVDPGQMAPPSGIAGPLPGWPAAYAAAMPSVVYYPVAGMSHPAAYGAGSGLVPARWDAGAYLSEAPLPSSEARLYAQTVPTTRMEGVPIVATAAATAAPSPFQTSPPIDPRRFDRWSFSAWGMFRQPQGAVPPGLATGGTLGGSQAGARLAYQVRRGLGVSARFSAPADQAGLAGEGALGIAWQPLGNVPIRLLAERRQRLGRFSDGRSAWALLAEGGVYDRPMPYGTRLNAYAQAGVVGARRRDLFVDGGATLTRPVKQKFAIGAGVWGGKQPGLSRLDVGPRLSMKWKRNISIHLDYRYKVLGNAQPGSGPAVTVGADF